MLSRLPHRPFRPRDYKQSIGEGNVRFFYENSSAVITFILGRVTVLWEILVGRIGFRTDFVGYDQLIDYISRRNVPLAAGDILEIGAFMGGGTAKLASAAEKSGTTVFVIDIFDPEFDQTKNTRGESMAWIYTSIVGRSCLRERFNRATERFKNIIVLATDSRKVRFPEKQRFVFSFIDGNHTPANVSADLSLAWRHTIPGGVVSCHDYGGDLPNVTSAINQFIVGARSQISDVEIIAKNKLIFIRKVSACVRSRQ